MEENKTILYNKEFVLKFLFFYSYHSSSCFEVPSFPQKNYDYKA
jgi:hypothetical protein